MESLKAEEKPNGWFSPLVFVSDHAHTNQQFVNCAYLKIRHHASAPSPYPVYQPCSTLYPVGAWHVFPYSLSRTSTSAGK